MNYPIKEKNDRERDVIDLRPIMSTFLKKAGIIILAGFFIAAAAFAWSAFLIKPQYAASVLLYVNNAPRLDHADVGIRLSDLDASKSLVNTYIVILQSRTTLQQVIDNTGVAYHHEELAEKIRAEQINETEVFRVTVTTNDPYESAVIANEIAAVLPHRIEAIIEGSSMKCVESAIVNTQKVSPSVLRYTMTGFLIGVLFACTVVAAMAVLKDEDHDEETL